MKKSLLALALLSAFAGAASAQTNVTVYGVVDAGITREFGTPMGGVAGSTTKLTSGAQSGSRLGFKGTEDLGGGLSANFVLENGFLEDTGGLGQGGLLFGRQAYVGLASKSWGAVNVGRQYTPTWLLLDSIDPFGSGTAGVAYNFMGMGTTIRMNNAVQYSAPNLSGFNADVIYGFGEVAGNSAANRQMGLSTRYANGPLNVGLAYLNTNNITDSNKSKLTLLGGTYDFGVAKAHLGYGLEKDDSGVLDQRDLLVGVSLPVSASGSVMASYIRKDDKSALNMDANQLALGYNYALSPRTNLYTAIARIDNKNGAAYTVGNASETGTTDKAFNIGIRHKF
ncbi:MAG: porin [Herminiimonas sp.]|nr:porin [Herminiimonas sp.]